MIWMCCARVGTEPLVKGGAGPVDDRDVPLEPLCPTAMWCNSTRRLVWCWPAWQPGCPGWFGADGLVFVDVDDTIGDVHGHAKQGEGFDYNSNFRQISPPKTMFEPGSSSIESPARSGTCFPEGVKMTVPFVDPKSRAITRQ